MPVNTEAAQLCQGALQSASTKQAPFGSLGLVGLSRVATIALALEFMHRVMFQDGVARKVTSAQKSIEVRIDRSQAHVMWLLQCQDNVAREQARG